MKENKTVTVNGQNFKMYRVGSTGWIFVQGTSGKWYDVAKVKGNEIVTVENQPAIQASTNRELAEAWIS